MSATYQAHDCNYSGVMNCPAFGCSGHRAATKVERPKDDWFPLDLWNDRGAKTFWICDYCGSVWSTEQRFAPLDLGIRAVGQYEGMGNRGFNADPSYRLKSVRSRQ